MSGSMEPPRLRDLDPLLRDAVERAHAQRPSAASIDSVVRAVEKASLGADSGSVGTLTALKSAALKLATLAAFSSGLWWGVSHFGPRQDARARAAKAAAPAPLAGPATVPSPTPGLAGRADPKVALTSANAKPTSQAAGQPAAVAPASEAGGESSSSTAERTEAASALPAAPRATQLAAYADSTANAPTHVSQSPRPSARSTPNARRVQTVERAQARKLSAPERELARPELALLEQAQEALQTSPEQALVLTEQHLLEYPRGAFAQEREQIAIEALFAAGRLPAMRERALHFRAAFPGSAYSARILELLKSAR